MKIEEIKPALTEIGDTLAKATDEILTKLQSLGEVPADVVEALDKIKAAAKTLDDIVPDAPVAPEQPAEETPA